MSNISSKHRLACITAILILTGIALGQTSYRASTEAWRKEREAGLKTDDGWLTVTGLFWLKEGVNNFGAAAENEIVLPPGSSPAQAGTFLLNKGKVTFRAAAGAHVSLGGKSGFSREAPISLTHRFSEVAGDRADPRTVSTVSSPHPKTVETVKGRPAPRQHLDKSRC